MGQPEVTSEIQEFALSLSLQNGIIEGREDCDLLADSHNILRRWKKYCSQLLNVHRASNVRQI
jgi:hypothetical protein